jgi:GntR family transcriptional regulator/MocR family aminotransferase
MALPYGGNGPVLRSNTVSDFWSTFGVDLHVDLDPSSGRRSGLEHALRDAVRSGRLAPGARLPSTRALAAELNLARGTVSAAYDQLVAEGYFVARQGSGTEVADLAQRPPETADAATAGPAPVYDLRPGSPDVSTFPTAAWLRSVRRALNAAPDDVYGYGDTRGRIELRTALADYLGRARGVLADPAQIVITSGYVQALSLLASTLYRSGVRSIAMEDPGGPAMYREVVRRAGPRIVALPVDERGARTELLAQRALPDVGAVIVTPAHQYPIGATLHPARRRTLIEWARASGGLIIEDDYDGEFRYDRQPVGALQGTAPDQVAYAGTASKTLAPGLRLSWLVLPRRLVEPFADAKLHADHGTEALGQLAFADLINSHAYDRHVRGVRLRYRRRRDLLVQRLDARPANPAHGFALHGIAAGMHALISLPGSGPDEDEMLAKAAARGLAVGSLGDHWHGDGPRMQGLIVGYGTPTERAYPAALDALAHVMGIVSRRVR